MWEGFKDYPMRKDYVEPDDYEYEPTAHDEVLEKARKRANAVAAADGH
jgi:NADH-quinone oxidoreductase subunit C